MASLNELIARGEVCRCLRSKKLHYRGDTSPEHVSSTVEGWEGPFWCVHTQSLTGPDGQEAGTDTCRPGRGCCEVA